MWYSKFLRDCEDLPVFKCNSCNRNLFRKQVVLKKKKNGIAYLEKNWNGDGDLYLCHTCLDYLSKGDIPKQAWFNDMELVERPDFIINEQHLVSPVLNFAKIVVLPKEN